MHATCVALDTAAGPRGVLLRGPSGAGKSDLALRLIDQGARLVADDQCELSRDSEGGALVVRAPQTISGKLEVRGVGVVEVAALAQAPAALLIDLVGPGDVDRMPEESREEILGSSLPRLTLNAFEPATPAKLRFALQVHANEISDQWSDRRDAASRNRAPEASAAPTADRRSVVLVTGMSGAGRSSALKILEDLGYEAVDNLPLDLLDALLDERGGDGAVAVGIDIRTRRFAAQPVLERLDALSARADLTVQLLFFDCDDEILVRRFTETRRRHPLAQDRRIADGLLAERRLVQPLRDRADLVIDTSDLALGELRRVLSGHLDPDRSRGMAIFVTSFSFRQGLPREADLVIDVRFLANPHYDEALRPLDGRDPRVVAFVEADPAFSDFFERLTGMLAPLLPRYEAEGKSYLTVALGCTGGRHRSVALAERLARWLEDQGRPVSLAHRDLAGEPGPPAAGS
ncbi:MAG TPA: RNase adapter RapZ [Kiloniellales bacterium]|nr:RNase adapter RapZ [Kiloniellales bacterium]